jgi:hypothetical protein
MIDGSQMTCSDAERHATRAIGLKVHAQLQKDPAVKVSAQEVVLDLFLARPPKVGLAQT